ncbi:MAG TPA: WbuC family cupin fold metalloprotein [Candidatus Binatia bacterium]|nr:WbuC family cupin fold metalloprotein [Candidatus Binatia bacterium]
MITASFSSSKALRDVGNGVFYATEPLATAGVAEIAFLKEQALLNPNKRSRLCMHRTPEDIVHEMLIVQHKDGYIRPHRHANKSESFAVVEGAVAVVIFEDDGSVKTVLELTAPSRQGSFFYRMPAQLWHGFVLRSEWIAFHESAQGPFDPRSTEFPNWAPDGRDADEAQRYLTQLERRLLAAQCR